MNATFAGERHSRRCTHHDESGTGVDAVEQSVEASADKWVVESSDRKQSLTKQFPRQSELTQHQE